MTRHDDLDYTTLTWVKRELDETLKQARQAMESYVEDQADASQMRFCATYLHQVQGTLRMVELYGAAQVAEEMEVLASHLVDTARPRDDEAFGVLLRGMVQLPDYLERLQSGHKDVPIVLLPLINELRAARGQAVLSAASLFAPNLHAPLPDSASGPKAPMAEDKLRVEANRLRNAFQTSLTRWMRDDQPRDMVARLFAVLERLRGITSVVEGRRLWWIAQAVVDGVKTGALDGASRELKLLFGKIDREIKRMVDFGEESFRVTPPTELCNHLLYHVATAKAHTPRMVAVRETYKLASLLPDQREIHHAQQSLAGRNRALLDTVGGAIREDLLRVKDALDIHLRTTGAKVGELLPLAEQLGRIADTLGMLGLGAPRKVVLDQKQLIEAISNGERSGDENSLLDIAGSLLYVEASLDDHIERLDITDADQAPAEQPIPQAELRRIMEQTMREAQQNLQSTKEAIVAFIESPWDHERLAEAPKLMEEVVGALRVIQHEEAGSMLDAVKLFVQRELLAHKRVPNAQQLDVLADAIVSVEYYLEALREQRPGRERALEVARRSVAALAQFGEPPASAPAAEVPEDLAPVVDATLSELERSLEAVGLAAEPDAAAVESTAPAPTAEALASSDPVVVAAPLDEAALALELAELKLDVENVEFGATLLEIDPAAARDQDLPALDVPSAVELPADLDDLDRLIQAYQDQPVAAPAVASSEQAPSDIAGLADAPIEMTEAVSIAPGDGLDALIVGETADQPVEPKALETGGLDLSQVEAELGQLETDFSEIGARLDAPEPSALAELPQSAVEPALPAPAVVAAPAAPAPKPKVASGFEVSVSNDIDEEIREVFLEEVQEVLDDLGVKYPQWKADPSSAERLVPIRRSFHTLKGSGRLVGAMAIGEFSWRIENMLNRVLDKTIEPTPQLIDLMDNAMRALPGLLDALRGEGGPEVDVGAVMHVSERLAAGDLVTLAEVLPADEPAAEAAPAMVEPPATATSLPEAEPEPVAVAVAAPPEVVEPMLADEALVSAVLADAIGVGETPTDGADIADAAIDLAAGADLTAADPVQAEPVDLQLAIEADEPAESLSPAALDLEAALADLDAFAADVAAADLTAVEPEPDAELAPGLETLNLEPAVFGVDAAVADGEPATIDMLDLDALDALAIDLAPETEPAISEFDLGSAIDVAEPVVAVVDDAIEDQAQVAVEAGAETFDDLAALDALAAIAEDYGQSLSELDAPELAAEPEFAASVDPVLLEILRSEVAAHLAVVDGFVATARSDSHHAATEALMRAVHTLNGAVSMIDIGALGDVTSPLESYIKRLYARQLAATVEGLEALGAASAFVAESVNELDRRAPSIDRSRVLVEQLARLRDALPPPEPMSGVAQTADQELADSAALIDVEPEAAADSLVLDTAAEELAQLAAEAGVDAEIEPGAEAELLGDTHAASVEAARDPFDELAALESAIAELKDELADAAASASDDVALGDEYAPESIAGTDDEVALEADATIDVRFDDLSAELATADLAAAMPFEADGSPDGPQQLATTPDAPDLDVDDGGVDLVGTIADEDFTVVEGEVPAEVLTDAADGAMATVIDEQSWFDAGDGAAVDLEGMSEAASSRFALEFDADPDGPLTGEDLDLDLLDIFLEEGNEILDSSDNLMARLREDPINRDYIIGLQRDLHTLKGGARMAGLAPVGDLAHSMESLFETLADGKQQVTRLTIEALESAFDRLHAMINRVSKRQSISEPIRAVEQLEALTRGELKFAPPVPAPAVAVVAPATPMLDDTLELASDDYSAALQAAMDDLAVDASDAVSLVADVAEVANEAPAAPTIEAAAALPMAEATPTPTPVRRVARPTRADEEDDAAGGLRTAQEVVRVRADLLDNLVNFAGEVSIYRSRLEQQIGSFRFNLLELDQTVLRLREQLRKLEIETEAQILSRYQREMEDPDREFDPLELDRFSTLQQLSRALAESVSDLQAIQGLLDDITRQSETLLLQQSRVSSELQEGLMRTRMVPFESLVPRLRRILRQTSGELDKRAQLRVEGAQGEMDRNVLDRMTAPLEHMLRNALAHGVESPADRKRQGKPEEGTVTINVTREATEVVLRVSDDGAGVSRDAVRRKAIERGLLRPDVQVSDRDLLQFILETGFSTADQVSKVAGRGVGMDVVASEIKQLGGSLQIDSTEGQGTVFTVRLPFTLAVTHAIMVRLGEVTYALPLSAVQGVVRMPKDQFERELDDAEARLSYAGEKYRLQELKQVLGLDIAAPIDEVQVPLVLIRTGDQRAAVRVDSILGSREIVVKSVGPQMSSVPGIFGATILGDGSVVIILDLAPLLRKTMAVRVEDLDVDTPAPVKAAAYEPTRQPLVLVVDDSITMRKVTTRVLERHAYEAITAKDGLDAVGVMAERVPDLVLLDIEMPRMDGYELAVHMRNDSRLRHVPIIMITSRTGEKHRQRAMEVGVNRYLGKPYQEPDLLANVKDALKESGVVH